MRRTMMLQNLSQLLAYGVLAALQFGLTASTKLNDVSRTWDP